MAMTDINHGCVDIDTPNRRGFNFSKYVNRLIGLIRGRINRLKAIRSPPHTHHLQLPFIRSILTHLSFFNKFNGFNRFKFMAILGETCGGAFRGVQVR